MTREFVPMEDYLLALRVVELRCGEICGAYVALAVLCGATGAFLVDGAWIWLTVAAVAVFVWQAHKAFRMAREVSEAITAILDGDSPQTPPPPPGGTPLGTA